MSGMPILYGEETDTIFKLFGTDENAITKSLSWTLMKCFEFTELFVKKVFGNIKMANNYVVYYQRFSYENGITDIEITDNENYHIIIKAKRGGICLKKSSLKNIQRKMILGAKTHGTRKSYPLSECGTEYTENYYEKIFKDKK